MRNYLFFILILYAFSLTGQDLDIYHKNSNSDFLLPHVSSAMQASEFQLLSRNLRMIDMLHATLVPGYIHFKAQSMTAGYALLTLRSLSYAAIISIYIDKKLNGESAISINPFQKDTPQGNTIVINSNWQIDSKDLISTAAYAIIIGTYLYDWIHGKYILERKKELIRYKYSLKFSIEKHHIQPNSYIPSMGISLQF